MIIRRWVFIICLLGVGALLTPLVWGQTPGKVGFRFLAEGGSPANYLLSSSVIDILPLGEDVLLGTGAGLSIWHSANSTWSSFGESFGLGTGSVSALNTRDGVIWAATAYTANTSEGYLPAGGGVGFSTDSGFTWTWYGQPVDSLNAPYDPTTTNVQNVTYDLLITSTEVWIASWGGGLRKFSFTDSVWVVVPPDTMSFSAFDHLNHRAFSLAGNDTLLWVGTAAGVNKSTDGGSTWQQYTAASYGLSGNFVVALGLQNWSNHQVLWAATWPATGSTEYYGVTKSEDGGLTWEVVLSDSDYSLKAHNFAFDDSAVYVATNLGLYKSLDAGQTWSKFPQIQDSATGEALLDPEVYSSLVHNTSTSTTLWVGTGDGVAVSNNYGNTWSLFRAFLPTGQNEQPSTYAYPNPFSPRLMPNGVRFQYNMTVPGPVTVKVYDFALDEVATVVEDKSRGAGDYYEIWYGKRTDGKNVATGVYYYSVKRGSGGTTWGKVAVIP